MKYKPPPYFILRRYRPDITHTHPELESVKNIMALISTEKIYNDVWSLTIENNPMAILENMELLESSEDIWFNNTIPTFTVYSDNKINSVVMKYNDYIIKHNSGIIPVFKISEPCVILTEEFFYLNHEVYNSFKIDLEQQPINKYIKELIAKGETCPISTLLLTRGNIRITTCGHAFSKDVEKWISQKGNCPVCRAPQSIGGLSKWI
jgi:hypothetical protein